jgi:hypothetical protein
MAVNQDLHAALDARCRDALRTYRLDAFDNIDVAALLARSRLSAREIRWIGRHLIQNGRALAAYRDGQAILAEVARAG